MKDKKKVAAIAAVMAYVNGGVVVDERALQDGADTAPVVAAPAAINLWGGSGRQSQMHLRTLLQMKSFHGSKLR